MISRIKDLATRTVEAVKNFTNHQVENLGFLIPMAICLTSIVSAVVSYIIFIVQGGYTSQIDLSRQYKLDGILMGFTFGNSHLLISDIVPKIILVLFAAEIIILLIAYFIEVKRAKRIVMIVDLVIIGILVLLPIVIVFVFGMATRRICNLGQFNNGKYYIYMNHKVVEK